MKNSNENLITKKDLNTLFVRSLPMESSFNYERMMSLAYVFCMYPLMNKLYKKDEDKKAYMKRHLEFFNTTSACAPFILGISAAMEEENSKSPDKFDVSTINSMKVGLMGPLAGVGDAIFWVSLRIITAGIGINLALQGNVIGPLVFVLLFNIPNYLFRFFGGRLGYQTGVSFIGRLTEGGIMDNISYAINILGMTVIGAMSVSMVEISLPFTFGNAEDPQTIMSTLDSIMPGILPLLLVFALYWLMTKKKVKTIYLLLGLIIIGIIGAATGILAVAG